MGAKSSGISLKLFHQTVSNFFIGSYNRNSFATAAALAKACSLLSAILVYYLRYCHKIMFWHYLIFEYLFIIDECVTFSFVLNS